MLEIEEVGWANRIIIEEAGLRQSAPTDEEVIDLIRRIPTHHATVGKPPQGAKILQTDLNSKWVIFEDAVGMKKIQFDVTAAENVGPKPLPQRGSGKRVTPETEAIVGPDGKVYVTEGMHRLEAAQNGATIPPHDGGISGLPGWLEHVLLPP